LEELLQRLKAVSVGTKITLDVIDMFGTHKMQCVLMSEPKQNGYITAGGAWTSFYSEKTGDKPSYEIQLKEYRKRKIGILKLRYIKDFVIGW
jgi:hypothetical protein